MLEKWRFLRFYYAEFQMRESHNWRAKLRALSRPHTLPLCTLIITKSADSIGMRTASKPLEMLQFRLSRLSLSRWRVATITLPSLLLRLLLHYFNSFFLMISSTCAVCGRGYFRYAEKKACYLRPFSFVLILKTLYFATDRERQTALSLKKYSTVYTLSIYCSLSYWCYLISS